jgi:hypothetical protein
MIIQVTQADIDAGVRKECTRCPVALAIQRNVGCVVEVGRYGIYFSGKMVMIPNNVAKRISIFDSGGGMTPFEFLI